MGTILPASTSLVLRLGNSVSFTAQQQDIKAETGYRLGMDATLNGHMIETHIHNSPIIGYRQWEVNDSNRLNFDYTTRMLDADMRLSTDGSSLALYTEPSKEPGKEWVNLDVNDLRLEEWLGKSALLPPIAGTLDADMRLLYDGRGIDGRAQVNIADFAYDGHHEGNVGLDTKLTMDPDNFSTQLDGRLNWDGSEVALAYGTLLGDSTKGAPMDLTVEMNRFPLSKVTPFIPGNLLVLQGDLEGKLMVKGSFEQMDINGMLQGDSATVTVPLYGAMMRLDNTPLMVSGGKVHFDNYRPVGLQRESHHHEWRC